MTGPVRALAALALAGWALAPPVAAPAAPFAPWTLYNKTHGLAGNRVQAIAADEAGGLLIGTDGGLSRFDGVRWETWTVADGLPDDRVHSLATDAAGRVWVGAGTGFGRLDNGRWSRLGIPAAAGAGRVAVASARDGSIWFGHAGGLMRYDAAAGTLSPVDALAGVPVRGLLADREERLWVAAGDGLRLLERGEWTVVGTRSGLPEGDVTALLEDASGTIWCGTSAGPATYDGVSWRLVGGWEAQRGGVLALAVDGEGNVWAGTAAGAGSFDGYDWRWFDASTGLPADEVFALAADPNGSIWIGTASGLARFDTSWFAPPAALREGPAPRAPLLAASDGMVYAGADRGLLSQKRRNVDEFGPREHFDVSVRVLREDAERRLWIGTDQGLFLYDNGIEEEHVPQVRTEYVERPWGAVEAQKVTVCDRSHGLMGPEVTAISPDGEGGIWVGTTRGLSRYHDGGWTCLDGEGLSPAREKVTALLLDPAGALWVGTPAGLWQLAAEGWTRHDRSAGLAGDEVTALLLDRSGALWVGTTDGASRREGSGWRTLGTRQGLVSDRILTMFEDAHGRLWFGTAEGVSLHDRGLFGSFGQQDGLPSPRIVSIAEAEGRIWLGAEEGVSVHRPDRAPPDTRLRNPPSGPVGTPFRLFEFAGADLESPPGALRYSWRLDDGAWSSYASASSVTVTDLVNGRHTFEVRALDRSLNEDPVPARAEFEVNTKLFDLELVEASFAPLYASLYQFYASDPDYESRPIGRLKLRSKFDRPLRVKVSAYLPDLMDFPTDAVVTVAPGETRDVPLRIELNDRALEIEETGTRQLRLTLQYTLAGERKESESTHPVTVIEKHGMRWDEPERIGLYVTHLDEAVDRFARETVRQFREDERAAIVDDNLLRAMELFDALGVYGVRYVPDPGNPYGGLVPGRPVLDNVRLPRETLRGRTGDCDDVAVLYAALLENIGIDAALVDVGDHVFVMFDTGLVGRQGRQVTRDASLLHVDSRHRVWVPVEVTLLGQPFSTAWQSAAGTMATRAFSVVELKEAWKKYAPLQPRVPAPDIVPPSAEAVRPLFSEDVRRQEEALTSPELKRLRRQADEQPDDALALNALGVLLARSGYLGQAAARFEGVIRLAPDFAGGYGNLANVLYEQGRYQEAVAQYEEALRREERPEVHVELALTLCEIGRFDIARAHYRRAMELAPGMFETEGRVRP